jgi:hypothetical protein
MHEARGRHQTGAVRRDRRNDGVVLGPAILVSALVHLVVLFGLSFRTQVEPRMPSAPVSRVVHVAPAMQAYDIVEVAGDVAPIEVQVIERAPLRAPPIRQTLPSASEVAPVETEIGRAPERDDPRSVRDRLRYHLTTPQLWRPPSEEIVAEPTPQEIVQRRIAAQLGEYNDSVAAEAAAAERAMDWTVKDADGGRWGVSPGAIHLGSITIPIGDSHFAVAPGRREEFAGRVRTWNELQDQAVREEAKSEFKDRVKAIEERMNRERAARVGTTPPPPPAPRDTTRSGGQPR